MKKTPVSFLPAIVLFLLFCLGTNTWAQRFPRFKVLAFYNDKVEKAHVEFALEAVKYFNYLNIGKGFVFDVTSDFSDCNIEKLNQYQLVIMLNDQPHGKDQREAFQQYMENGGGWMGFHVAAYNDRNTNWPWYLDFLGGGVFHRNNWPSMTAKVVVDKEHPVTRGLPQAFVAPENEWYQWKPSPRENKDIEVLVTLSPENYPLGLKDILVDGDLPVVWTNTKYRMIYLNMGHDGKAFTDATQNHLIINAFRWVVSIDKNGDPFKK
ncbi:MAG: ThuA domain-containing protein [Bacteroidales bacterium]|jgi:type 1 glutamine amidotransferase|nr:ThuA domain-containing protein [Bacteroidales bacterium]